MTSPTTLLVSCVRLFYFLYPCDLKCFLNSVAFVSTTSFQSLEPLGDFGKKSSTYDHPSPVGVCQILSQQGRLQEKNYFPVSQIYEIEE